MDGVDKTHTSWWDPHSTIYIPESPESQLPERKRHVVRKVNRNRLPVLKLITIMLLACSDVGLTLDDVEVYLDEIILCIRCATCNLDRLHHWLWWCVGMANSVGYHDVCIISTPFIYFVRSFQGMSQNWWRSKVQVDRTKETVETITPMLKLSWDNHDAIQPVHKVTQTLMKGKLKCQLDSKLIWPLEVFNGRCSILIVLYGWVHLSFGFTSFLGSCPKMI